MAPCMTLQVVYLGLLDVAYVLKAQVALPDGEVQRKELTHGRLVVQGGEADVLSPIFGQGHFIIRLSVFGCKHQADKWQIQLIAEQERMLLDAELIHGHARCPEVGICLGIHRIVRISEIVYQSSVQINVRTDQELQLIVDGELVKVCQVPVGQEREFASGSCLVAEHGHVSLEYTLAGELAVQVLGFTHVLAQDAQLRSRVFHGGEVSVQLVGVPYPVKGSAGNDAILLGMDA